MRTLLICFLLSSATAASWAGTISLETQITTSVKGEKLEVGVHATNKGTEAAYNVQFKGEAPGSTAESPLLQIMPVGKSTLYTFHHSLKDVLPGRYAYIVHILYADANLYPLSALSLASFVNQKDAVPSVFGILEKTEIRDRGRMSLKLKGLGSADLA